METIIIDGLEIWPEDLGEMTWDEAMSEVKELDPGWRLPTIKEFKEILYPNMEKIPGNVDKYGYYWSSTEIDTYFAWNFNFYNGNADCEYSKYDPLYVCIVRALTGNVAIEYLLKDF